MQGELGRILIPAIREFPQSDLASLTDALLQVRRTLETDYVMALGAKLPETGAGEAVTLAADAVLSHCGWPTITLLHYRQRGALTIPDRAARVGATLRANRWEVADGAIEAVLRLFLEPHGDKHWDDVADLKLPQPASAASFVAHFEAKRRSGASVVERICVAPARS